MYKKCPFCGQDPSIYAVHPVYTLTCNTCKVKGIILNITASSEIELQSLWNSRVATLKSATEDEFGKESFGYLIMPDGDIIQCDENHLQVLFDYLGIDCEAIGRKDYEDYCRELKLIRISNYLTQVFIDIPERYTKAQMEKCIETLYNYNSLCKYSVYYKQVMHEYNNLSECVLGLDGEIK